ncbi:MAG: peptidylprolyl isomerase [Acidobacteriota bacterium]
MAIDPMTVIDLNLLSTLRWTGALAWLFLVSFGCGGSSHRLPALLDPHDQLLVQPAPPLFQVKMETTRGEFTIEAHRDWAPHGVDRFYNLVRAGFYDDSRFFRVRSGFIAQFGIPGDPRIAAVWRNRTIPDDPVEQTNAFGTVAYAMTGPGTRTTQIFINLADNTRLDAEGFAPIGRVITGMEVVTRLYAGYGERSGGGMRGGKQGPLLEGGNDFLDRWFPALDHLERARLVPLHP